MAAKVKALQGWCKVQCDGYRDVEVKNMTSSWKSGLAFCAMIHRYRPDLIDYDSLKKEDVFENNRLAFEVAEKQLNIPALLDAEDMEAMAVPDKLCIVTYVSQYYNYFRNKDKLGGPGVKGKVAPKRQIVDSKQAGTPDTKKPHTQPQSELLTVESPASSASSPPVRRGSSTGDLCSICQGKVYIMERHIEGSKLFHRRCLRESQRSKCTINQNGGLSPRQKRAYQATDHTTSSPNNQNEKREEHVIKVGQGKENIKPFVGNGVPVKSPPASSANGLFSKVLGAPKPYTSIVQNDTSQSKDLEKSKCTAGASIGTDTGSAEPRRKYVQDKVAKDDKKKDFQPVQPTKKPDEPMDTSDRSGRKYDIVGALVNNSPSGNSSKQSQVVTSKPFTSSPSIQTAKVESKSTNNSTGEGQVLQGLLKSLAGVRRPDVNSKALSPERGHLNGTSKTEERWKKDSDTQWSGPKDSTPKCTSKSNEKEDFTAARSRLKPAQTQSNTEKDSKNSKLTNYKLTEPETKTTSEATAVKPILRHKTDIPSDTKVQPKSILRSPNDSETEESSRLRSVSPPKSILKHSDDGKTVHTVETKKSSSPTRPILRHVEESSKDHNLTQPKSILKTKPEENSESVSKIILKKSHDHDEGQEKTFQTPKSILKKSTEDLSDITEESKNIPSKPVLSSIDDLGALCKEEPKKSWSSKLTDLFSRPSTTDKKKTDLLSHVQLDDTEEPMETEVHTPTPKPRKSILKSNDTEQVTPKAKGSEGKPNKSSWYADMPTPEPSSHSPASSTVFSSDGTVSLEKKNNFNAFNLADSIDLVIDKNTTNKTGKTSQEKQAATAKTAWQIEMEARQGIRQKESKTSPSTFASKVDAAHRLKQRDIQTSHANSNAGSDLTAKNDTKPAWQVEALNRQKHWKQVDADKPHSPRGDAVPSKVTETVKSDSGKPAWQIEAERRQAERKGEYKDPEKFLRSKEIQVYPKTDNKDKKKKNAMNIDKPLSPRSVPPRPAALPNHNQKSPPPRPSTSPVASSKAPAPDFVNSELDIFGRTSKAEGIGKKVNRSPAFKISPESSPRSNESREDELVQRRKSSGSPEELVTDWQKEAQRWQANRASGFVDPETKKLISPVKPFDQDSDEYVETDRLAVAGEDSNDNTKKKKIVPDTRFSFTELKYSKDMTHESWQEESISPRPTPPERPPWVGKGFPGRPLPSPPSSVVKREVTAEPQIAQEAITTELLSIDVALRGMEDTGKTLEQKIRLRSEDDMDEDELMIQWFELVNEKNDLVRRETELMYKQKQQELEVQHTEVEYELRMLMSTPDHKKTPSDRVREETLLQELMETVSQRNSIVDSMEEDRKRYIEEDQEIAEVLATKDFRSGSFTKSSPPPPQPADKAPRKEKKKKDKKEKKKKSSGNRDSVSTQSEQVVMENGGKNGTKCKKGKDSKPKKKKHKDKRMTGCIESTEWYD